MNKDEALGWINGSLSMMNLVPREPFETWQARIAEADAFMTQRAYWVLKSHKEGLVNE